MSILKWTTPIEEMNLLRRELEGFLNTPGYSGNSSDFNPPVEVVETETHYQVRILLPGLPADQISEHVHLDATPKTLAVSGEMHPRELQPGEKVLVNQFRHGQFFKQLSFPDGVDHERIEAAYKNGVLEISLPKALAVQKRSIQIQTS
ncbi:Hsp20/alpha crystallin family protein [Vampirovibrio chlorellavorus]|uniref:Hsp20/alpha crystallin family protein n=1 Tax=Vampirovibrio chlorellavorus TaxID=758823 RepID=UPI0026EE78B1|nr:Hsp20/alpha crystallin family protein [Vampirovibrio chlorellavorus]